LNTRQSVIDVSVHSDIHELSGFLLKSFPPADEIKILFFIYIYKQSIRERSVMVAREVWDFSEPFNSDALDNLILIK